jgi:DNA-binding NarL/FixJ family response regulator
MAAGDATNAMHITQIQHSLESILSDLPALVPWVGIGMTILLFAAALGGVWMVRKQIGRVGVQLANRDSALSNLAAELEAQALLARQMSMDLEELRKRLVNREEASPPASIWATAGAPVNLNRRGQILRLSRKGKTVAEISQDLNVAQGEVELLLKVHDLKQKDLTEEEK